MSVDTEEKPTVTTESEALSKKTVDAVSIEETVPICMVAGLTVAMQERILSSFLGGSQATRTVSCPVVGTMALSREDRRQSMWLTLALAPSALAALLAALLLALLLALGASASLLFEEEEVFDSSLFEEEEEGPGCSAREARTFAESGCSSEGDSPTTKW